MSEQKKAELRLTGTEYLGDTSTPTQTTMPGLGDAVAKLRERATIELRDAVIRYDSALTEANTRKRLLVQTVRASSEILDRGQLGEATGASPRQIALWLSPTAEETGD